ncbi:Cytochrome P450 72A14 [Camellia lanceoleosa]|uniref:Cytochrome P450 72A14 n=1 Tax=Camellia lanceoleosa TaxID=1840588 RepID=A0ACC0H5B8_9ERIC|nr:Cytochrome P450 72A14 [Camellia lanceoleosa]
MTMIFYEVLKLYPTVPILSRTIHKKTKVRKLVLLPGVELLLPVMSIHRDCEIWDENATEFKPGRFSEGITKATKSPGTFLPFGGGPVPALDKTLRWWKQE